MKEPEDSAETEIGLDPEELVGLDPHFETDEAYLVTVDGTDRLLPKTFRTELLVSHGIEGFWAGEEPLTFHMGDLSLRVRKNGERTYQIERSPGRLISVSPDYEDVLLGALKDALEGGDIEYLDNVYGQIRGEQVDTDLMDEFVGTRGFEDERIEIRDDGWVLDDQYLVTYQGDNYSLDDEDTYVRGGDGLKRIQGDRQFLELSVPEGVGPIETEVDRGEVTLYEDEIEFLTTARVLLYPEERFDTDVARRITEHDFDTPSDVFSDPASKSSEGRFRDNQSGIRHKHGISKHVEDFSKLNPTDELKQKLFYNFYDHVGVWEMLYRRAELENAPFELFTDVGNGDEDRWDEIQSAANRAVLEDKHHQDLKDTFGPQTR
jgi:hypothetical protein